MARALMSTTSWPVARHRQIRRKKRWLPIAALAACAVLAISIPLAVRSANSTKSASTADTSAAETPAAPHESAYRLPPALGGAVTVARPGTQPSWTR